MATLRQRSIAKLTLSPKLSDYREECGGVVTCMFALSGAGEPFAGLSALLAIAESDLDDLSTKSFAASGATRSQVTLAERDTAWGVSRLDMESLVHGVQMVADLNPATAVEVITKAGMRIWITHRPTKAAFSVKCGATSGTAIAKMRSPGPRRSIQVQGSADGGKTWTLDVFGPELVQPFSGLTPGVVYTFRYRVKLPKKAMSDWSDSVTLMMR